MALVPLSVDDMEDLLVVGPPSGPQYAIYWGRTKVRLIKYMGMKCQNRPSYLISEI